MAAASSSSGQDPPNPSAPLALPSSSVASRRLPPPCWSHDETVALIDAYREKWYSLRRGNLRASHWQEVAEVVAARCPLSSGNPQKTSVQCRHKMEKLRKRYRAELQRAAANPAGRHRYSSSWVQFKRMDAMEKGPTSVVVPVNSAPIDEEEEDDEEEEEEEDDNDEDYHGSFYPKAIKSSAPRSRTLYGPTSNGVTGNGVRIRIPGGQNVVPPPPTARVYNKFEDFKNPYPNYGARKNFRDEYMGRLGMGNSGGGGAVVEKVGKKRENDPMAEMVAALKVLGDGFVKVERMKMDMAREIEVMRMEMELKRSEMILESQQRIVEAFGEMISERDEENKKVRRMPSPES